MSAFGDAFKAARSSGKKTFSFNGKLYHTKTKDEMAKTTQKAAAEQTRASSPPVPSSRPDSPASSSVGSLSTADARRTPMFSQAAESAQPSSPAGRSSASLAIPTKRAESGKTDEGAKTANGRRERWDPRPKPTPFKWPEPSRRRDWDKKKT